MLDAYSSGERAGYTIAQFGPPELLRDVGRVRAIRDEHRDGIGLVKGFPYMPQDLRTAPFVGAWGVFPLERYVETAQLTLLHAYR